ncbi:MAG: hypothetical protein JSR09_05855 [Bacteroidetes bacterium]|nr:hypothetical protein [Bacteroidota bacterium]
MFSFFKKKNNPQFVDNFIKNFGQDLSEDQKGAIMATLLVLATNQFTVSISKDESTNLDKISSLIKFDKKGNSMDSAIKKGGEYTSSILRTMPDDKKDWFVGVLTAILNSSKNPSETKKKLAFTIIANIGVDGERYVSILKRMEQFS